MKEELEAQITAIRSLIEEMEARAESLKDAWTEYTYFPEDMLDGLDGEVQARLKYAELLETAMHALAGLCVTFDGGAKSEDRDDWIAEAITLPIYEIAFAGHHRPEVDLPRHATNDEHDAVRKIVAGAVQDAA